jgi:hypothetical protein
VEAAVELLPQLGARALARADQEHSLGRLSSLAGQAAAVAVAAGQPGRAVELLEQTRGILVAEILDARGSDVTRLARYSADLAAEFTALRARIDNLDRQRVPVPDSAGQPHYERARALERRAAYEAWDQLVARIRRVPGFESFLMPADIGRLASYAQGGPVVLAYTSKSRSDALILTSDLHAPVRVVPLALTEDEAYRQANRLMDALQADGCVGADAAAQAEILDILGWLWEAVAAPVLSALGHTGSTADGEEWPRLWWSPAGILAFLPLHAAGHHRDPAGKPGRTVMDRVVSSYISTVRSLGYTQSQNLDPAVSAPLVIAVPDPPGAPPLPGAELEAQLLIRMLPTAQVLPHPTRDAVLAAIRGRSLVHFACHGTSDWEDPGASQLILYDYHVTPLTVAEISATRLTGGLAYLSACETGLPSPDLINEAVHVTGAFHLAGFRHVVGTLWPVNDGIAAAIAQDFYGRLTDDGNVPPDISHTSRVLHDVIRELRDSDPDTPTFWVAHTHTGI